VLCFGNPLKGGDKKRLLPDKYCHVNLNLGGGRKIIELKKQGSMVIVLAAALFFMASLFYPSPSISADTIKIGDAFQG
jgi:hypothetical protein